MKVARGEIEIRRATAADVPEMAASRSNDREAGPADARMGAYLEGRHDPQAALRLREVYLARVGERVVGYIAGHLTGRFGCQGEVQYLYVAPEYRRNGIARMLLQRLAAWFVEHHAVEVCVDVNAHSVGAEPFYATCGAEQLRRHWMVWSDISRVVGSVT